MTAGSASTRARCSKSASCHRRSVRRDVSRSPTLSADTTGIVRLTDLDRAAHDVASGHETTFVDAMMRRWPSRGWTPLDQLWSGQPGALARVEDEHGRGPATSRARAPPHGAKVPHCTVPLVRASLLVGRRPLPWRRELGRRSGTPADPLPVPRARSTRRRRGSAARRRDGATRRGWWRRFPSGPCRGTVDRTGKRCSRCCGTPSRPVGGPSSSR